MIRKALHPEYYKPQNPGPAGEDGLLGPHHIDHCVDAIRQSLMCSVDVSVLVWTWLPERQAHFERATVPHTCRNFEKIQEWGREHRVSGPFDREFRELNDPLDPSTWTEGFSG